MPGYTIHIIIAKEYIKKHPNEIKDIDEFIKGNISPDLTTDKNISHYGIWNDNTTEINFNKMKCDKKVDFKEDFWKGYFYHLFIDNKFYNDYFDIEWHNSINNNDNLFNDYFILNKKLIEDFGIDINIYPNNIKEKMIPLYGDAKTKYLDYKKTKKFINIMSQINIPEEIKKII